MKRILAAALIVCLSSPVAALAAAQPGLAEVIYDHPENFTDIKDRYQATEQGRQGILDELNRSIVYFATKYYVPEGDKLTMTFKDIDLAGDFEPWRGPEFDHIRVVKAIYPPAFKFDYQVTDASGRVLMQGQEHIRDLNFDLRISVDQNDPLHYEKDILKDWMRQKLSDLKKH